MAFSFKNWIFGLFPDYWKETDSYKDNFDRGLWERYCANFDFEFNDEFYVFIGTILDFYNGLKIDPTYLPYAAYNAGDLGLTGDTDIDRRLVAWAISLYKVKGAEPGFKLIFNLLGFPDIIIVENFPHKQNRYDDDVTIYDGTNLDDNTPMTYDSSACPSCVEYSIIYDMGGTIVTLTKDQWALIQKLVCSIQAIDAKLVGMIPILSMSDTWSTGSWVESITPALSSCVTPAGTAITPLPTLYRTILKPVMEIVNLSSTKPSILGYYYERYQGTADFVNFFAFIPNYISPNDNSCNYQAIPAFVLGTPPPIMPQFVAQPMAIKQIDYHFDWDSGTRGNVLVWGDTIIGVTTIHFEDIHGNVARLSSLVVLPDDDQVPLEYLVANLDIEVYSWATGSVTFLLTRSHDNSNTGMFETPLGHKTLNWQDDAVGGIPYPLDPTNNNKTLITLATGLHTVGVKTDYVDDGLSLTLGHSWMQVVLQIL